MSFIIGFRAVHARALAANANAAISSERISTISAIHEMVQPTVRSTAHSDESSYRQALTHARPQHTRLHTSIYSHAVYSCVNI